MGLKNFIERTSRTMAPPALPAPPPRKRPPTMAEQLAADLRELSSPGNADWASWNAKARGQWSRSVLAIADLFQLDIPEAFAPWLAFWARK